VDQRRGGERPSGSGGGESEKLWVLGGPTCKIRDGSNRPGFYYLRNETDSVGLALSPRRRGPAVLTFELVRRCGWRAGPGPLATDVVGRGVR
jgi:hypothetical protein